MVPDVEIYENSDFEFLRHKIIAINEKIENYAEKYDDMLNEIIKLTDKIGELMELFSK